MKIGELLQLLHGRRFGGRRRRGGLGILRRGRVLWRRCVLLRLLLLLQLLDLRLLGRQLLLRGLLLVGLLILARPALLLVMLHRAGRCGKYR